jgi:hypothetical protein
MRRSVVIAVLAAVSVLPACTTSAAAPSASPKSSGARVSSEGAITGQLVVEGGPSAAPPMRPVPGTVKFTAGSLVVTTIVGKSGAFAVTLVAGKYKIWARTPNIEGPSGEEPFAFMTAVTVTAGHATNVTLPFYVP